MRGFMLLHLLHTVTAAQLSRTQVGTVQTTHLSLRRSTPDRPVFPHLEYMTDRDTPGGSARTEDSYPERIRGVVLWTLPPTHPGYMENMEQTSATTPQEPLPTDINRGLPQDDLVGSIIDKEILSPGAFPQGQLSWNLKTLTGLGALTSSPLPARGGGSPQATPVDPIDLTTSWDAEIRMDTDHRGRPQTAVLPARPRRGAITPTAGLVNTTGAPSLNTTRLGTGTSGASVLNTTRSGTGTSDLNTTRSGTGTSGASDLNTTRSGTGTAGTAGSPATRWSWGSTSLTVLGIVLVTLAFLFSMYCTVKQLYEKFSETDGETWISPRGSYTVNPDIISMELM